MEYMRASLVKIDDKDLVKIFDDSISFDLRNKLIEYEIEYTFYCAEDKARTNSSNQNPPITETKCAPTEDSDSPPNVSTESTSTVADATATVIIQHLLANNHLKSLCSNYSY